MDDPALFMPHLEFTQNLGLTLETSSAAVSKCFNAFHIVLLRAYDRTQTRANDRHRESFRNASTPPKFAVQALNEVIGADPRPVAVGWCFPNTFSPPSWPSPSALFEPPSFLFAQRLYTIALAQRGQRAALRRILSKIRARARCQSSCFCLNFTRASRDLC